MKKLVTFLTIAVIGVTLAISYTASAAGEVVINEIAWMGTTTSASDEWIELANTTQEDISLEGWLLKTTDGKIKIYLTGRIKAGDFYLLERTDDNSVSNIKADFIYKGSLGNEGQSLELYKGSATLIDNVAFSSKWPSGNNTTKQTMQRDILGAWQTSPSSNGTPRAQNGLAVKENPPPKEEPVSKAATNPEPPKALPKNYPSGVIISEILPAPEGPDETHEWIEIHNTSSVDVDLTGWKLKDAKGSITTYAFSKNKHLPAKSYLVLKRPETKITLNNDEDTVNLLFPSGAMGDTVSYKSAQKNQSYSLLNSTWNWNSNMTPGSANSAPTKTALQKINESDNNDDIQVGLASIGNSINKNLEVFSTTLDKNGQTSANPWILFFAALVVSIISGATILFLKIKILNRTSYHERP